MAQKCTCGHIMKQNKKLHEIKIELNNPGTVKFKAPAIKCKKCGDHMFHEKDADAVFDAFDKALKKK